MVAAGIWSPEGPRNIIKGRGALNKFAGLLSESFISPPWSLASALIQPSKFDFVGDPDQIG